MAAQLPKGLELPAGRLQVLANCDSTADWQLARRYGAQGIGPDEHGEANLEGSPHC